MAHKSKNNDTKNNLLGFFGTTIFHGLLLLFLIFVVFKTPIPPYPEEGGGGSGLGIEVNLGNSDEGMGINQPEELAMPNFTEPKRQMVQPAEDDGDTKKTNTGEKLLTQENDEMSVPESEKNKVTKSSPKEEPKVNPNALYRKKTTTGNEGVTGKPGDQGNPNGNVHSKNYSGNGGTGSGGGTGGGIGGGNGIGIGRGSQPSYSLSGRQANFIPLPVSRSREQGKVVVAITVNRKGEVTKAVAGVRGTTTTDNSLWKLAEQSALKARFDPKAEAPEEQKGTITYIFITRN